MVNKPFLNGRLYFISSCAKANVTACYVIFLRQLSADCSFLFGDVPPSYARDWFAPLFFMQMMNPSQSEAGIMTSSSWAITLKAADRISNVFRPKRKEFSIIRECFLYYSPLNILHTFNTTSISLSGYYYKYFLIYKCLYFEIGFNDEHLLNRFVLWKILAYIYLPSQIQNISLGI